MQTLLVALILAAVVGAVFLIARRGYWGYAQRLSDKAHGVSGETAIANFLLCSVVGPTTTRRIGQALHINEPLQIFPQQSECASRDARGRGGLGTTLSHRDRLVASLGSEGLFNEI